MQVCCTWCTYFVSTLIEVPYDIAVYKGFLNARCCRIGHDNPNFLGDNLCVPAVGRSRFDDALAKRIAADESASDWVDPVTALVRSVRNASTDDARSTSLFPDACIQTLASQESLSAQAVRVGIHFLVYDLDFLGLLILVQIY